MTEKQGPQDRPIMIQYAFCPRCEMIMALPKTKIDSILAGFNPDKVKIKHTCGEYIPISDFKDKSPPTQTNFSGGANDA